MSHRSYGWLIAAALGICPAPLDAQTRLTGSIAGLVSNSLGIPQMGATVTLFNHLEKPVASTLTNDRGLFRFDSLPAGLYSVKVSLASFFPARMSHVSVQPGMRRVLSINLAAVFSTIELVYSAPIEQGLMSDDWKWVLRGSLATRPILRIFDSSADSRLRVRAGSGMFSHTRGVLKLSAGDAAAAPTLGSQPDLGTAFALATSFLGANQLSITGNLGYGAQSGNPAAGFRTAFSRDVGWGRTPEVAITMRQIFLNGRAGSAVATGNTRSLPALSTMSVGMADRIQVSDRLLVTYGATLESVSFLERLNYLSSYAQITYAMDDLGTVELGFSSGLPPSELYAGHYNQQDADYQRQISGVAVFPRVSLRDGRAAVQRSQNFELGFRKDFRTRSFSIGAYRESMRNAALTAMGADGAFAASDLLPDLFSKASIFNAGRFETTGYTASLRQALSPDWSLTVAYGSSGVLEAASEGLAADSPNALRSVIRTQRRHWAAARLAGALPVTGTRFTTSYHFMNGRALTPGHFYITQRVNPEQGWNLYVRQPIPGMGMMPGKLEATADIRNILAQGYQPIQLASGRRIQLVHSPRAMRGGLALIF